VAFACGKKAETQRRPRALGVSRGFARQAGARLAAEPEFGGFYAAREDGAYARHAIGIEIQGGGAGVPVLQMVATGRATSAQSALMK